MPLPRAALMSRLASQAAGLLGLVFLLSAALKLRDLPAFDALVASLGLLPSPQATGYATRLLIAAELFLGLLLFLPGWRRPWGLALTGAMLLGFSLFLVWMGWAKGATECGCFGLTLPMTPVQAIVKNLLLLGLAVLAWRYLPVVPRGPWRQPLGVAAFAWGFVLLAFPVRPPAPLPPQAPLARFAAPDFALDRGQALVVLASADCEHCQAAAGQIAALAPERQGTAVYYLILGNATETRDFIQSTRLASPWKPIDPAAFWAVAKATPAIFLLRNGALVKRWDGPEEFKVAELAPLLRAP